MFLSSRSKKKNQKRDEPIQLLNHVSSFTTQTANATVTLVTLKEITQLPAALSLEKGRYNFIVDNGLPVGARKLRVDATGTPQEWHITPGNKKALPAWIGTLVGITGVTLGTTMVIVGSATSSTDDLYSDPSYDELNNSTKDINNRFKKAGWITNGISVVISVPCIIMFIKNKTKVKQVTPTT